MRPVTVLGVCLVLGLYGGAIAAAPQYLIDARGWDGRQTARLVVRAIPQMMRAEAWGGRVVVEGGELLEVRVRSREGRVATPGVSLEADSFQVEANQPMHDLAIELTGDANTRIIVELAGEPVAATIGELRADDRRFALEGGGEVRLLLTFVYPPDHPQPIRQLKPIIAATELMVGGAARCVIATPADGRYAQLARSVQEALGRHGDAPEIVAAEALIDEHLQPDAAALSAAHVIAIGNVLDNRLAGGLWGRGQALASQLYPGPGGYVIRTIHDPYGLGRNVLLLAGSDAEGVAKAVTRFLQAYVPAEGDVVLPVPMVDVQYHWVEHPGVPDLWPKRMPPVRDMAYLREQCVAAGVMDEAGQVLRADGDANAVTGRVISALTVLGETWWFLGLDELPPLMGQIAELNVEALEGYVARPTEEMEGSITPFTATWDLIEELPVFSDRVRLAITNALLAQARLGHEPRAMHALAREGCRQIHDENHGTNSALNDLVPWSYFDLYYDLPEADYWLAMVDALFRGQTGSFQIPEDAAGYMTSCPDHAMTYAFLRPNLEYLERGVARAICDYFLAVGVNNLGLMTGFGDTSGLVPVGYFPNLARAGWYYRDGRYRWALENLLHKNSGLRAYSNRYPLRDDVPAVEPVELTGILVQPVYERPVDKGGGRLDPVYLPPEPIADGRFNEVALREAWGADRQYLLISGMTGDGHTQEHVNAVINFTDNGKMWLVDHEYGLRRAADHSGIVGMRDGAFINPARQAFVEEAADFDRVGLLGTRVALGALSWKRNVTWLKGGWFAVLDDLTAGEDGEYFLRTSWRGLGAESLLPDRLVLAQDEQRYEVVTDGAGSLDLQVVPFASDDEWRGFYPGVDPAAKVLRQDKVLNLQAGEAAHFATLLAAHAEGAAQIDLAPLDGGAAVVRIGEQGWVVASGPFEAAGVSFAGAQALLGAETIALAGATALRLGGEQVLSAAPPVSLHVALDTGRASVQAPANGARITWRGRQVSLPADGEPLTVDVTGLGPAAAQAVARAMEMAMARKQQALAGETAPGLDGLLSLGSIELGSPVTALAPTGEASVVGLADGTVVLLGRDGQPSWRWQAEGPITALAAADLNADGAPEVLAASADGLVHALRDGAVLWRFEVRGSDTASYRHGKALVPADLDADGSPEILVVAPFLHCLRADGTQAWEEYLAFWRNMWRTNCGAVAAGDLDGDGRLEVVSSWIDGYSGTRVLKANGEPVVTPDSGDDFSPKINHGPPTGVLGLDFNGDGRGDIAVGYDGGVVTFPYDSAARFGEEAINVGPVLHLLAGRSAEHDPLLIATNDMADVRALYHREGDAPYRLREAWRASVREPITAAVAADLDGDGLTEIIVGTRRGNARIISSAGEILASANAWRGAVTAIGVLGGAPPQIVLARSDGSVQWLCLQR
ncbi:MAG: hypothetical protein AB7Y46_03230 [Armatimonadota bacterium]